MAKLVLKPKGRSAKGAHKWSEGCDIVTTSTQELYKFVNTKQSFTVFAYGETNTGKSYTINKLTNEICRRREWKCPAKLCAVEVACTGVYSLFPKRCAMKPHEQCDATGAYVASCAEAIESIKQIMRQRSHRATPENASSSRSHLVICLIEGPIRYCFVDLAGHEQHSGHESSFINVSLMCLKECVVALEHRAKHVPYRRSRLTMCIKGFLFCQVYCICTVDLSASPSGTSATMKYGLAMKGMKRIKHVISDTDLKKYVAHTKRLASLEEEILEKYIETRDVLLLDIVKKILASRDSVTRYITKMLHDV